MGYRKSKSGVPEAQIVNSIEAISKTSVDRARQVLNRVKSQRRGEYKIVKIDDKTWKEVRV